MSARQTAQVVSGHVLAEAHYARQSGRPVFGSPSRHACTGGCHSSINHFYALAGRVKAQHLLHYPPTSSIHRDFSVTRFSFSSWNYRCGFPVTLPPPDPTPPPPLAKGRWIDLIGCCSPISSEGGMFEPVNGAAVAVVEAVTADSSSSFVPTSIVRWQS